MTDVYDLVVIGGGSGGVRAARVAADLGARVALCEQQALGGTCVNVGCVPKKLFVYASQYRELFRQAPGFGWHAGNIRFDWATLRDNTRQEIRRLNSVYQHLLDKAGVETIAGHATLHAANQVQINGRTLTARHVIIATGGSPYMPAINGIEHAVNSDQIFELQHFPAEIVIVGGGYIATEFAGIFQGLGSQVTIINRGKSILGGFDDELAGFVAEEMSKLGINIRNNEEVTAIETVANKLHCQLKTGNSLSADTVLMATGRHPHSRQFAESPLDIAVDHAGFIVVDQHFQTSCKGIYAIGDVTGGSQLTPVAIAQGQWLARHLFANEKIDPDIRLIPTSVFGHPALASVGLSETAAREQYADIVCLTQTFHPMRQSLGGGQTAMRVKAIIDQRSDRVLGIHIAGDDAAEILQGFAAAMQAGLTRQQLNRTIGIHPTSAEELVTLG